MTSRERLNSQKIKTLVPALPAAGCVALDKSLLLSGVFLLISKH